MVIRYHSGCGDRKPALRFPICHGSSGALTHRIVRRVFWPREELHKGYMPPWGWWRCLSRGALHDTSTGYIALVGDWIRWDALLVLRARIWYLIIGACVISSDQHSSPSTIAMPRLENVSLVRYLGPRVGGVKSV